MLSSKYGYAHLSTGDLLRGEVMAGTERWVRLFETITRGLLVPDVRISTIKISSDSLIQDEVIELLSHSMSKLSSSPGFLIDGFPANMNQAEIFISKIQAPHKIIFLDVPESVMTPRLKDGVNFNDSDETIKKRISTYLEHTKPTVDSILKKWNLISKTVGSSL